MARKRAFLLIAAENTSALIMRKPSTRKKARKTNTKYGGGSGVLMRSRTKTALPKLCRNRRRDRRTYSKKNAKTSDFQAKAAIRFFRRVCLTIRARRAFWHEMDHARKN